jgi:predicted Zn-dependent protease
MKSRAAQIVLCVLLAAASLHASEIEGQVRANGAVVIQGTVQLFRERVPMEDRFIGSNGRFEFRNLMPGSYSVRIRAEGFSEQEVAVTLITVKSREVVMVDMRPVDKATPKPGGVISVIEAQIPQAAKREFEKGAEERKRGQCAKAIPHLQKAVADFEQYADALNELGHCFRETNEFAKSEESFKKAIEYTSTIFPSMNLADLYESQKRFQEAEEVLRRSMVKFPSEGDLHFAVARVYFDQNRWKEAEEAGLEAHSKRHRLADVHLLLAKIYLRFEKHPAVVAQLQLYVAENPKGPTADLVRKNLAEMSKQ